MVARGPWSATWRRADREAALNEKSLILRRPLSTFPTSSSVDLPKFQRRQSPPRTSTLRRQHPNEKIHSARRHLIFSRCLRARACQPRRPTALSPMEVTEPGMVTEGSERQQLNAPLLIEVTELGMVTEASELQASNA